MTVQELIDQLMKVEDKSKEIRVGENRPDSEHIYDIQGVDYYSGSNNNDLTMEWKIGEIKQINGKWYQCVERSGCCECSLVTTECLHGKSDLAIEVFGNCSKSRRSDNKNVIFKKLEKVGEPTLINGKRVQLIKALEPNTSCYNCCFYSDRKCLIPKINHESNSFYVEIKQNKEDMEQETKLKKFDLEAAKAGKPVCTRDGRKARIICFDKQDERPIIALIQNNNREDVYYYHNNGVNLINNTLSDNDLMMLPEKKEGWVNLYKECNGIRVERFVYNTEKEAFDNAEPDNYIATVKIQWEE